MPEARVRRYILGLPLALACFAQARSARAESLPLDLSWEAPSECPTGKSIALGVLRMARPRAGQRLPALVAHAVVTHRLAGYHLIIEVERDGAPSHAEFDSPSCAPLERVATLVLALAYGDSVELHEQNDALDIPAPPPPPPPPHERTVSVGERPASTAPPRQSFALAPFVGAAFSSGFVGKAAFGGEMGLELLEPAWSVALRGDATLPSASAARDGVRARFSTLTGALGACARTPFRRLSLGACLSFEAGVVHARSSGAQIEGGANVPVYALSPALLARVPLTARFALRFELGAALPLSPPRYSVAGEGTLYRSATVEPRASLALAVTL